jgi:hypothetical protein
MHHRFRAPALLGIAAACAVLLGSCTNTFDPKTTYTERLVVYCAIDAASPVQTARLEFTYDAASTNPNEPIGQHPVDSAVVRVNTDRKSYIFRDTTITGPDGPKKVWISRDLLPRVGESYTLQVRLPDGRTVSAQTVMPSKAYLTVTATDGGLRLSGIPTTAFPPGGFYFRLFVAGTKVENGVDVELRREVAARYEQTSDTYYYPSPSRQYSAFFSSGLILDARDKLRAEAGVAGRTIIAVAYTMDDYLYSYYKTVRGFDDPVSVRQDKPDVTNIRGGAGVFGCSYADSVRMIYGEIGM